MEGGACPYQNIRCSLSSVLAPMLVAGSRQVQRNWILSVLASQHMWDPTSPSALKYSKASFR